MKKNKYTLVPRKIDYQIISVRRLTDNVVFQVGDIIWDCNYAQQQIRSFNVNDSFGGIMVDCGKENHTIELALSHIHKDQSGKEIYLAEELLLGNGYGLQHPNGTFSRKMTNKSN